MRDNLFLSATGYEDALSALPEPLRSQMRDGSFTAGRADAVWQTIPTAWIKAAQARWKPRESKGDMTGMGFDPARGGQDKSTLARAHTGNWIDELLQVPGVVTDDGPKAAAWVVQHVRNGAPVAVDSIGIGSSALDFCVQLGLNMHPVVGSEAANYELLARYIEHNNLAGAFRAISADLETCRAFADGYNGPGYRKFDYHSKIAARMK